MSEKTSQLLDKFDGDVKTYVGMPEKKQRKQKSIYADQLLCLIAKALCNLEYYFLRTLTISPTKTWW